MRLSLSTLLTIRAVLDYGEICLWAGFALVVSIKLAFRGGLE